MRSKWKQLWNDQTGVVISAELIVICTVVLSVGFVQGNCPAQWSTTEMPTPTSISVSRQVATRGRCTTLAKVHVRLSFNMMYERRLSIL